MIRSLYALIALVLVPVGIGNATHAPEPKFAPAVADVALHTDTVVDELIRENRLTEHVRTQTYGGALKPHPLIEKASLILAEGLESQARYVFVTSMARSPEDQERLMGERRYRYWTTKRSKHLLGGYAFDVGFVKRKKSMNSLKKLSEKLLADALGEDAKILRVVRESRCIHVEIDSTVGAADIQKRVQRLVGLGIIDDIPQDHIVPRLTDYKKENHWLRRPAQLAQALPF